MAVLWATSHFLVRSNGRDERVVSRPITCLPQYNLAKHVPLFIGYLGIWVYKHCIISKLNQLHVVRAVG
ncbi:hypothetical protein SAMN05216304_10268 [Bosea sp. OK403]|nr:hypothetical protein SAMN05216304_10268 [Bosea sp. OK403]